MLRRLFSSQGQQPSEEEVDLLLGQALQDVCGRQPPQGGWDRLQARIRAREARQARAAQLQYRIASAEERRASAAAMNCFWETLTCPQSWSRLTI